jgi:hypothetical protein
MIEPEFHQRPFDLTFQQILEEANSIILDLKSDGYRVSNSCRFSLFVSELSKFIKNNYGGRDQNFDLALLAEGVRDFLELRAIIKSSKVRTDNRRELQVLLGGTSIPSNDRNTYFRDLQYQLYLVAIFDLSGFFVEISEPDFIFKYEDVTYAVAAKRISSEQKIHARFSKAKKQLIKGNVSGFIAFSLDRIVWNKVKRDAYIVADKPDTLYEAGKTILMDLLRTKVKKAAWENRDPLIVGHIASLTIPAVLPKLLSIGVSSTQLFIPSIDVSQESTTYKHIWELPGKLKWPSTSL